MQIRIKEREMKTKKERERESGYCMKKERHKKNGVYLFVFIEMILNNFGKEVTSWFIKFSDRFI